MGQATPTLESARILVVGASAGIGRAFAHHAVALGGQVCFAARRADLLAEACAQAGGGTPLVGDVTDPSDCRRLVADAATALGGLDLVVYSAGVANLAPIEAVDPAGWTRDFQVNVLGPTMICAAALDVLSEHGMVAFLSSESTAECRFGMSSYASAKAALDTTIRYWRHEHPHRRFQRIVMGATMPTEFGNNFDVGILGLALDRWAAAGTSMTAMETLDVGRHLAELMAVILAHPAIDVPDICLDPRGLPIS